MCVYSMVADHFYDRWRHPWVEPSVPVSPFVPTPPAPAKPACPFTQEEIDRLRDLLKKAKDIDEATGQPDCENDAKKKALQDLANQWGFEINFP